MTPQEAERRRSERDRANSDNQVLTFSEWCSSNTFSLATGRRIRRAGNGPRFIRLSDRRIGVTIGENRRWHRERVLIESNHDD
jgi:hypothetical protein